MDSADPVPSLAGKTVTGGRLNVYQALTVGSSTNFLNLLSVGPATEEDFPEITGYAFINTAAGRDGSLAPSAFTVYEDSITQTITSVTPISGSTAGADIVFLFDDTGSMGTNIATMKAKATTFANDVVAAGIDARFGLVSFKDEPEIDLTLTDSIISFQSAVNNLTAMGGGDLPEDALDATVLALNNLTYRSGAQKVFVIVTDAPTHYRGDGTSYTNYTIPEVIDLLNTAGVTLFAVSPNLESTAGVTNNKGEAVELFATSADNDVRFLAEGTSGIWLDISSADFSLILDAITDIMANQWLFTYTTTNNARNGTTRNVTLVIDDPVEGPDSDTDLYIAPVDPPDIEITPAFFDVTLPEGTVATETLTISNVGSSNLDWTLNISSSVSVTPPVPDVLILRDGVTENRVETVLSAAGFNVTTSSVLEYQWDGTNPNPSGFDTIVLLDGQTYDSAMSVAGQAALLNFVQNGGGLILTEWIAFEAGSHSTMAALIPLTRSSGVNGTETYAVVATHPVVEGVNPSFTITTGTNVGSANSGTVLVTGSSAGDAVVAKEAGLGRVVEFASAGSYEGNDPFNEANMQRLLVNAVSWVAGSSWLSVMPNSGTVTPGSADNVTVTLDATDLTAGTYTGTLNIASNDPDENPVAVPVTLHVVPATCEATLAITPPAQNIFLGGG
ncbi:MAG: VWA domain-containing protein, partial [Chloroflexi bacterium]|nr:VWA domain-containing protein [Chloroflexota bacterium]